MGNCISSTASEQHEEVVQELETSCTNQAEAASTEEQAVAHVEGGSLHPASSPSDMLTLKQDTPDTRDLVFAVAEHSKVKGKKLPACVDLRPDEDFPIYDQGSLGSCTANALAAAFHFEQWRQGQKDFCPSRLFIYYNERSLEGKADEDASASLRDGLRVLHKLGVCEESMWPYREEEFASQPPEECFEAAKAHRVLKYARVDQTLESLKGCLAAGHPFVFGFAVFSAFIEGEEGRTGIMTFPPKGSHHGSHAVQACGYDDAKEAFVVRNSLGPDWGDHGHFHMPYKFIVQPDLCMDFWAVLMVEGGEFPIKKPSGKGCVPCMGCLSTRAAKGGA